MFVEWLNKHQTDYWCWQSKKIWIRCKPLRILYGRKKMTVHIYQNLSISKVCSPTLYQGSLSITLFCRQGILSKFRIMKCPTPQEFIRITGRIPSVLSSFHLPNWHHFVTRWNIYFKWHEHHTFGRAVWIWLLLLFSSIKQFPWVLPIVPSSSRF